MLQVFCPACENVVQVDGAAESTLCPECSQPLQALAARKARPVSQGAHAEADQSPRVDTRVARLPRARKTALPPAPAGATAVPAEPTTKERQEKTANRGGEEEPDVFFEWNEPPPRFVPLPYRPDGGFSPARLPLFAAPLVGGGLGLGWLASALGQVCYLILLFPLAVGMILAGLGVVACMVGRVRNPFLAGLTALTAAAAAILAMHYFDYQRTLHHINTAPHLVPAAVRESLARDNSPLSYLDAAARAGMTIALRDGAAFNLGRAGTWTYWAVELLLAATLAVVGARHGAREPFCAECQSWKEERRLGTLRDVGDVVKLLRKGDLTMLLACRPGGRGDGLAVTLAVCPHCREEAPIDVKVERGSARSNAAKPAGEVAYLTFPGEALPVIQGSFR